MRRATTACLLTLLCLAACNREAPPPAADTAPAKDATPAPWADDPSAQRIEADVRALSDDAMEGRETGTRGYAMASDHVAKRFAAIGLQPAGDGGTFFQQVPLLKAVREREGATFAVKRNGRSIALRFRDQFLPSPDFNAPQAAVEAPAVFVGQAVHAPALGVDDFKGLALKGKIAVLFGGAPARFDDDRRAFHSSYREKLRAVVAHGAIGAVFVNTAQDEAGSPWAQHAANWDKPAMRLRDADGRGIDTFPQLRVVASVSAAAADLVLADGPRTAAQLFDAARDGTLKGFALPGTIALASRTTVEPIESRNVVARLPGSDPALGAEHVIYSAHLDHVGIGAPVEGDRIYNGALDNALGVAIMLEAAQQLAAAKDKPKRSALFVAVTAEEKGLLGAEWFATHPTVPPDSMVANINMDMPVLMAPTTDVVPIGVEHSTLKATLDAAAKDVGVALSPDPFPEESVFVRSDQYAFIRAGVPAVYLTGGVVSADAEGGRDPKVALRYFLRNCYHRPCDDADTQPIQYGDAARMARLNARIGQLVGDAAERPRWNDGDFFGEMFARGTNGEGGQ
ncbi:M20/M25/M40 family metallo-hydrolase [Luteimonas sp. 22616]|uniref:M20/M25/M40 family metallo-hydrolase n=1 Tax=Luteimonas sp. 22616 TaxID=3453951 RepID=UPI003F85D032